jgi:hypothetical protein
VGANPSEPIRERCSKLAAVVAVKRKLLTADLTGVRKAHRSASEWVAE